MTSTTTEACGARKPSVGATLKFGKKAVLSHLNEAPKSPEFSICNLRVTEQPSQTVPVGEKGKEGKEGKEGHEGHEGHEGKEKQSKRIGFSALLHCTAQVPLHPLAPSLHPLCTPLLTKRQRVRPQRHFDGLATARDRQQFALRTRHGHADFFVEGFNAFQGMKLKGRGGRGERGTTATETNGQKTVKKP